MLGFGNKKQNLNQQQPYNMAQQTTNSNNGYSNGQIPQQMQQNAQPLPQQQNSQMPQQDAGRLEEYINRRNAEIDAQVQEFMRKNPGFDMRREIQNPQFCNYVWGNGLSVEDAYYLVHRNDKEDMNSYDMNRSQSRIPEKRISENGTGRSGGSGIVKKNPKDLSDEEIDEIVRRVRDGEKISF